MLQGLFCWPLLRACSFSCLRVRAVQSNRCAFTNTFDGISAERAATAQDMGFADMGQWMRDGKVLIDYDLNMDGASFGGYVDSVTMRGQIMSDLPGNRMDMSLGLGAMGGTLFEANLAVSEDIVAFSIPGYSSNYYGMDMATFSDDLWDSDLYYYVPSWMEDISFSPSEIMQQIVESGNVSEELQQSFDTLDDDFWGLAQVEKLGSATASVNGSSLACETYRIVMDREAFLDFVETYLNTAMDIYLRMDGSTELLAQQGLSSRDVSSAIQTLVDELDSAMGDSPEFTAYVYQDALVKLEGVVEGARGNFDEMTLLMEFGNEYNLSDALTIELLVDGVGFRYSESGNQVISNGIYSRTLEFEVLSSYGSSESVVFELWYDTKASRDNFVVNIFPEGTGSDVSFSIEGTLQMNAAGKIFQADLYNIVYYDGWDWYEFDLEFTVDGNGSFSFDRMDPIMLMDMSDDELDELFDELEEYFELGLGETGLG